MNFYSDNWHNKRLVYIAYSAKLELTKIGITDSVTSRIQNLNSQGLGGYKGKDWKVFDFVNVTDFGIPAGLVEDEIARRLKKRWAGLVSYSSTSKQPSKECYQIEPQEALNTLHSVLLACGTNNIAQENLRTILEENKVFSTHIESLSDEYFNIELTRHKCNYSSLVLDITT